MTTLTEPPAPQSLQPAHRSPHLELLRATEQFARTVRNTGVDLARRVECSRPGLGIVRAVAEQGPLTVGDVAHNLRVDLSVASRQVSLLVDDGLLERSVDTDDRRVRTIALTEHGHARARAIEQVLERRTATVFSQWTDDEIDQAVAVLDRLASCIAAADEHPPPAA
ncbi:MarR family winged helix-turn-helix transcriptional regulator [Cellulomonas sp. HZM]|uniref:MarR family winged helix-turn-helix transcriptional regulator n=1 Tax=Cellulomonas sp. HZM TaxID=1454010 RepID=UPI00068C008F|nr:MarR family transcriptional regulator [Cellulomonas sp. HZM]